MKVLFAVNNENVSEEIVKKYQKDYKEIISYKNVYYFNAIIKEIQRDKSYDRIVIGEDLEPFANNNYDTIDKFLFEKLDSISDEATDNGEKDAQIILICSDRRSKSDSLLVKLFGIGIYSAIVGKDRSIEEVCRLINTPRTKKDAKQYYHIDSDDVNYKQENDSDVNENEIQSILKHYKSLGKNEERYIDSFNNIASQYTDAQLRVIIKFLPLNVKAVLEANSPKYQQVVMFGDKQYKKKNTANIVKPIENSQEPARRKSNSISDDDLKIDSIEKRVSNPLTGKPIIIPSVVKKEKTVQVERMLNDQESTQTEEPIDEETEDVKQPMLQAEPKRGRGRPKKIVDEKEEKIVEPVKRGRGRPKKVTEQSVNLFGLAEEEESLKGDMVSETNAKYEQQGAVLPGLNDEDNENNLNETLSKEYEQPIEREYISNNTMQSNNYNLKQENNVPQNNYSYMPNYVDDQKRYDYEQSSQIEKRGASYNSYDVNNLITGDKKIVAFVGSTKNGTSFVVNNIAALLSSMGINTAILDVTENKNSYFIYTKNEEELRKIAYTSVPGEEIDSENVQNILKTLVNNHEIVLLDCDFNTKKEYFEIAQEIYLVQSMDVLTIQPLTAFMRDLKNAGILKPEKLRVIINKYTKIRGLNERVLIGGMAFYNSPSMSFMTELFNKDNIKFYTIPLDTSTYVAYLEALVSCEISLNRYPKIFMQSLKELAQMVYPLLNKQTYKPREIKQNSTGAATGGHFSDNMNSTLEQMSRMKNGY